VNKKKIRRKRRVQRKRIRGGERTKKTEKQKETLTGTKKEKRGVQPKEGAERRQVPSKKYYGLAGNRLKSGKTGIQKREKTEEKFGEPHEPHEGTSKR